MKKMFFFGLLLVGAGLAYAQPGQELDRSRIAAERSRAQAGFAIEDSACYQRFWVNDCLDAVKARRLELLADLRRQEVALNDQERKTQGAQQLQKIEEKQSLAQQQAQVDALALAAKKSQTKIDRGASKTQGSNLPEAQQAARAQANRNAAADRLKANQAKLAGRAQKQQMDAQEAQKFQAKQQKAKERQEKNKASRTTKTKAPSLPPPPPR